MAFLTDEEQKRPSWDPFAAWAERAKQTEVEPEAGPAPVQSWGNGAIGRPSEALVDPDTAMSRLLSDQWRWLKHGVPPSRHVPEGVWLGIVPPAD